jgi:hypothetical protein
MRAVFDKLNDSRAQYYSLTEHLSLDEIIVLVKDLQTVYTREMQVVWVKALQAV